MAFRAGRVGAAGIGATAVLVALWLLTEPRSDPLIRFFGAVISPAGLAALLFASSSPGAPRRTALLVLVAASLVAMTGVSLVGYGLARGYWPWTGQPLIVAGWYLLLTTVLLLEGVRLLGTRALQPWATAAPLVAAAMAIAGAAWTVGEIATRADDYTVVTAVWGALHISLLPIGLAAFAMISSLAADQSQSDGRIRRCALGAGALIAALWLAVAFYAATRENGTFSGTDRILSAAEVLLIMLSLAGAIALTRPTPPDRLGERDASH